MKLDPRHSPKSDSAAPPKSSQLAVRRVAWVPVANFATRNPREGYLLFDPNRRRRCECVKGTTNENDRKDMQSF